MISRVRLKNYRQFRELDLFLDTQLTLLVGDNDSGKSTILEAIELCSTGRLPGMYSLSEIPSHLINADVVEEYLDSLNSGNRPPMPEFYVELYLSDPDPTSQVKGKHNSSELDAWGLTITGGLDPDLAAEYSALVSKGAKLRSFPTEFFRIVWQGFDGGQNHRLLSRAARSYKVDASKAKLSLRSDPGIKNAVANSLEAADRATLGTKFRQTLDDFGELPEIQQINESINAEPNGILAGEISLRFDTGPASRWAEILEPFLDRWPLHHHGGGTQTRAKISIAIRQGVQAGNIVLLEEPENQLSFPSLRELLSNLQSQLASDHQLIMSTHSAYVTNRLGLDHLVLIAHQKVMKLSNLDDETVKYFKRLSGFDTLRPIVSTETILVEGPADEIIVQRSFKEILGEYPLDLGIDVFSIGGLAFKRYLSIAKQLNLKLVIIRDNDGDHDKAIHDLEEIGADTVRIFVGIGDQCPSLEEQILQANGLKNTQSLLNLNVNKYQSEDSVLKWMQSYKTEAALRILESGAPFTVPRYIRDAVEVFRP